MWQCNIKRTFSSHFTLHFSHPALHASHVHFTFHSSSYLKSYLKSSDFFSPHVTSSDLFSSHPIPSHVSSKQVLLNCFHFIRALEKVHSTQLSSPARQKALTIRKKSCAQKALSAQSFCAQKLETQMHLDRKILTTYFLLHSMHKKLPIITLFAQSTSQHYFVLQSLRKALPSTTSYYVACTKHFPILLCTAKLAQSTSQYYFVLQSLHKARPSTTLYYAACTKQWTTTRCRTQRRNRSRSVRPQPHLPHSRGTFFIAGRSHFTRKNTRFPAPAFSQNEAHATSMQPLQCITMRFATSGCAHHPASLDAHGNTKRQQSCSHYTAICNQRVNKRTESRTHEQALVAEHRGGTDRARPQPHPPHTRGIFHRRPEPLYTEKHKVSCPGFLPKRSPCNIHAAITMHYNAFCNIRLCTPPSIACSLTSLIVIWCKPQVYFVCDVNFHTTQHWV